MFDVTTIKNPEVVAFEEKIPGMFAALVQHETQAVQDVIGRYARGRMGDVPLHVGSEIDLATVTAIAVPVLANAVITSSLLDLWVATETPTDGAALFEKKAAFLVEDMVTKHALVCP
jgi:hypothetical protein